VQAGGAIIDTTKFNINFLEPLQTDPNLLGAPDGGLVKKGSGTLTMAAASTYVGDTVISNGTLAVNGSLGQTAVRVAGGTLSGPAASAATSLSSQWHDFTGGNRQRRHFDHQRQPSCSKGVTRWTSIRARDE